MAAAGSVETIEVYWRSQCVHRRQQTPSHVYPNLITRERIHRSRQRKEELNRLVSGVEEKERQNPIDECPVARAEPEVVNQQRQSRGKYQARSFLRCFSSVGSFFLNIQNIYYGSHFIKTCTLKGWEAADYSMLGRPCY